jgi:protease I
MLGKAVKPDLLLKEAKAADYDAVVFIGGSGAGEYWNSPLAHALARSAAEAGRVVGAICIAPVTLANAGLLDGKMATVWPDCRNQLRQKGAQIAADMPVVRDGRIVTGSGPVAAEAFGRELVKALTLA